MKYTHISLIRSFLIVGMFLILIAGTPVFSQSLEVVDESTIWTNDDPDVSRHSFFPFAVQFEDGTIMAAHQMGSEFDSVDGSTRLSVSKDMGKTWELLPVFYDKTKLVPMRSECMKPTYLGHGKMLLFGYEFLRPNKEVPLANPATGGLSHGYMILFRSDDYGKTWKGPEKVSSRWKNPVEASAPFLLLKNGDWISPITEFLNWEGKRTEPSCGRLLRTSDQGKTWNDDAVTMNLGPNVSVFEQRICQLEKSGNLVVIAWNEDFVTGELYDNHYAISRDDGKTFSEPKSTGIRGQASSVCAIGDDRLLALHAVRRDSDRPGVYAYIVNLENGDWNIEREKLLWEPASPLVKDENAPEVFAFVKFGQPGAVVLNDGSILVTFWMFDGDQGKTVALRLAYDKTSK